MKKFLVFALCGYFMPFGGFTQSSSVGQFLDQIEHNNKELKAISEFVSSKKLELKSGNNLPDPQLGGLYLPFGDHNNGDYTEIQISQSIEFPTVYSTRSNLIGQQSVQLDLEYRGRRQQILVQAKELCLKLIYLNKRLDTEVFRMEQAKHVFNQTQELYELEQIGILELNKAKVSWMQEQFKVQQIENDMKNVKLQLKNLNGGIETNFTFNDYETRLDLPSKDSIWQEKQVKDPELMQLKQQEVIAQHSLILAKTKSLPDLTIGYNNQGVVGDRFSGFYAGVSIPLWSNRHKVDAAKSQLNFQQFFTASNTQQAYTTFEKSYNGYESMLSKYQEYKATLAGLNSDELLLKAYQLGELSFLEYYMELQFYRQAYDAMLEIQYQLYLSQNQILKHQL